MSKQLYLNAVTLLIALAMGNIARAEDAVSPSKDSSEYGSIYMMEQRDRVIMPWRTGLSYSYDFGNPYSDVHGLGLTLEHSIGRFIWVGVQGNYFMSSNTALMNTLQNDLHVPGIGNTVHIPKYSVYPIFTLVPLSGHFNFFGNRPIEAELAVRIGVGSIAYADTTRMGLLWSLRPTFHIDSRWTIQTGFGQEVESPFASHDQLSHFKGDLGVLFGF